PPGFPPPSGTPEGWRQYSPGCSPARSSRGLDTTGTGRGCTRGTPAGPLGMWNRARRSRSFEGDALQLRHVPVAEALDLELRLEDLVLVSAAGLGLLQLEQLGLQLLRHEGHKVAGLDGQPQRSY